MATDENSNARSGRLLRVIIGPNSGAELDLQPGRYTVGTDDECDLVTRDRTMSGHHAVLEIRKDTVLITPADGAVRVDGSLIDGPTPVADFTPVLVGSTGVAFGPADVDWPTIDFTPREEAENAPAASPPTPTSGVSTTASSAPTRGDQDTAVPRAAAAGAARGRRRRLAGLAAAVAALVALGGAWISRDFEGGSRQSVPDTAPAASDEERIQQVISRMDLTGHVTVQKRDNAGQDVLVLQGYVPTRIDRQTLLQAVQQISPSVELQIWATSLLRSSLQDALRGAAAPLMIAAIDDGKVRLEGVMKDDAAVEAVRQRLLADVSGIQSLDMDVVTLVDAQNWLNSEMAKHSLPVGSIELSPDKNELTIKGDIDPSSQAAWTTVIESFDEKFGHQIAISDNVTITAIADASGVEFNLTVRAISLGPPAYLTLDNNQKYTAGSVLPNGMVLETIAADRMTLRDNGRIRTIQIEAETGALIASEGGESSSP